jgi:hypothetical protein
LTGLQDTQDSGHSALVFGHQVNFVVVTAPKTGLKQVIIQSIPFIPSETLNLHSSTGNAGQVIL